MAASPGRTLLGWKDKETDAFGGVSAIDGTSFHDCGANHTFLSPTGSNINVTGIRARQTNRFSLSESGDFVRAQGRPFTICGLPNVDYFRVGAGGSSIWLRDGRTMLATAVTSGVGSAESRSRHKLSIVALRSGDQGYTWSYSGLVASADEVPSAHEGPSENALARLTNGSLIVVFRVAGENGITLRTTQRSRTMMGRAGPIYAPFVDGQVRQWLQAVCCRDSSPSKVARLSSLAAVHRRALTMCSYGSMRPAMATCGGRIRSPIGTTSS